MSAAKKRKLWSRLAVYEVVMAAQKSGVLTEKFGERTYLFSRGRGWEIATIVSIGNYTIHGHGSNPRQALKSSGILESVKEHYTSEKVPG